MQDRLTNLEIKLAHAEQSIIELSDEIFRQQQHIEQLMRQVLELNERIQTSDSAVGSGKAEDEKPPHY